MPSPGGRRIALKRKWELNVQHYGGPVMLLTVTAPGHDLLPEAEGCECGGGAECIECLGARVRKLHWNATAQKRMSRLFEAAQRSADRYVRRMWGGELPRQIGNAQGYYRGGLLHFHYLLPMGSEVEKAWSRHVRKFIEAARRREFGLPLQARELALAAELRGEPVKGIYGFGYNHPGRAGRQALDAARYAAKNAAGYAAGQGLRHYVSARLTRATGVTMRALRGCNYLWVRHKLIGQGELLDTWVPGHWSDAWAAEVLRVWRAVDGRGPPRPLGWDMT